MFHEAIIENRLTDKFWALIFMKQLQRAHTSWIHLSGLLVSTRGCLFLQGFGRWHTVIDIVQNVETSHGSSLPTHTAISSMSMVCSSKG